MYELAEKFVKMVAQRRDRLDALVIFPFMLEVMRLNKIGKFTMELLVQSRSAAAYFMEKKEQEGLVNRLKIWKPCFCSLFKSF